MATGQGLATVGALELTDLKHLCEILSGINAKYHPLGLQIDLDPNEIDSIEMDYKSSQERLREVLKARLKMSQPLTWGDICNALRSDMVGESKLAEETWSSIVTPDSCLKHQRGKKIVKKQKAMHDKQYSELYKVKQPKLCNKQKAKRIGDDKCQQKAKEKIFNTTGEGKTYVKPKQKKLAKVSQGEVGIVAECCRLESKISDVGPKLEGSMQVGSETDSYVTCSEGEQDVTIAYVCQKKTSWNFQKEQIEGSAEKIIKQATSLSATPIVASKGVNSSEDDESRNSISNEEITQSSDDNKDVKTKSIALYKQTRTKRAAAIADSDNSSEEQEKSTEKRSKTRTRQSCMRPRATGRSYPYTLIEESQLKSCPRRQSRKSEQESSMMKCAIETSTSFTESSESSEEFDHLSPIENKNLRKLFKRFFGKLCCIINNPEDIGSELQLQGILSKKFMSELLMSVEPQQTNVIYLVNTLDKIVKRHPVKIFTIIKVFLTNPSLQESGQQMWKEAGISTIFLCAKYCI